MARISANILIWFVLTQEISGIIFEGMWETPLTVFDTLLFTALPVVHLIPWEMFLFVTMLAAAGRSQRKQVAEIGKSIALTFGGLALMWCWGVARGGSAYQTLWQLHSFVVGLLIAWLVAATVKTRAHVRSIARMIVFAAVYRAFTLIAFWLAVARYKLIPLPTLTDHADSVLFTTALFILVVYAMDRRSAGNIFKAGLMTALMFTAMGLNNRRIAWLDVGVATIAAYALYPEGKFKKSMSRLLVVAAPFALIYLAAGWGHPTGIFKPVGSISTMFGDHQDPSSIMRDIENYNLMRTLKQHIFLGSGFGHEYVEEVRAFDISMIFPQYRYLPHNSLLGVVAFTGMIGFALIWQTIVVSIFMLAKVCYGSKDPLLRSTAHACLISMMTVIVQYWGDVGFNHLGVNVTMGISIGLSARLPALAGLWPPPRLPARQPAPERELAPRALDGYSRGNM